MDFHWTVADFGRRSHSIEKINLRVDSARYTEDAIRGDVAKVVANLYVLVIFDEQLVESRKTSLKGRMREVAGFWTPGCRCSVSPGSERRGPGPGRPQA